MLVKKRNAAFRNGIVWGKTESNIEDFEDCRD